MKRSRRRRTPLPREQRFVTLHLWMLDCDAFQALSGNAVKLLVRLASRFNGANNGAISMSTREAKAELGCSLNHAAKCFHELTDAGFIQATQRGAFSYKKRHATTWRLTWLDCGDQLATKEFMRPDRGRRQLVNGVLTEPAAPARKKITVSHGDTASSTP